MDKSKAVILRVNNRNAEFVSEGQVFLHFGAGLLRRGQPRDLQADAGNLWSHGPQPACFAYAGFLHGYVSADDDSEFVADGQSK